MSELLLSDTAKNVLLAYDVLSNQDVKDLCIDAQKSNKTLQEYLISNGIIHPNNVRIIDMVKKKYLKMDKEEIISLFDIQKAKSKLNLLNPINSMNSTQNGTKRFEDFFSFDETINNQDNKKNEIKEGSIIGKYQVLKEIGKGGTSKVFLVYHKFLKSNFAIKILCKDGLENCNDLDLEEVFLNEAINTIKLNHENIVKTYDADKYEDSTYIVMEFVDGTTLSNILEQKKSLDQNKCIEIMLNVLNALNYASKNQIIHRDIKPGNIMITNKGVVKISDFGLAKVLNNIDKFETQSGNLIGTPYYMSPEQYLDNTLVDHRSDIYSLGVTFYQILTGKLPFDGNSIVEVMMKHLKELPLEPKNLNNNISSSLSNIVLKMIEKDIDKRFQSYEELIAILDDYIKKNSLNYTFS